MMENRKREREKEGGKGGGFHPLFIHVYTVFRIAFRRVGVKGEKNRSSMGTVFSRRERRGYQQRKRLIDLHLT